MASSSEIFGEYTIMKIIAEMEYKVADSIIISIAMRKGEFEYDMLAVVDVGEPRCNCDGIGRGKVREWFKIRITMKDVVSNVEATESE
jgi:hypothetical protein